MFSRLSRQPFKNIQLRKYWIAHTEPTHDIVSTIGDCQKWQLTYLVKKNYTNHFVGSNIYMEPKKLLNCTKFLQVKKNLELEKYTVNVLKDNTLGPNTFGVKFDEFNRKVDIFV